MAGRWRWLAAQKNFDGLVSVLKGLATQINEVTGSEKVSITLAPRGNVWVQATRVGLQDDSDIPPVDRFLIGSKYSGAGLDPEYRPAR